MSMHSCKLIRVFSEHSKGEETETHHSDQEHVALRTAWTVEKITAMVGENQVENYVNLYFSHWRLPEPVVMAVARTP